MADAVRWIETGVPDFYKADVMGCDPLVGWDEAGWFWQVWDQTGMEKIVESRPEGYKSAANAKRACERWLKKTGRL